MARRELGEINAGSMADIAFLLLIFFLVTTTMDQDKGIRRILPPIDDSPPEENIVKKKNVYEVLVNANDQLLVEDRPMQVENLKDGAIEFLTNGGVFKDLAADEDMTVRTWVRRSDVEAEIAKYTSYLETDTANAKRWRNEISSWESKLFAIKEFGEYKELLPAAVISLQNDAGTTYAMYMEVQNELTSAINELRDELTVPRYGKAYLALDEKSERNIIKAVRKVYPQRISEAEPKDYGAIE